jgi:hypothetical protein
MVLLSTATAVAGLEVAIRVLRPEPWWYKVVEEQKPEIRDNIIEIGGMVVRSAPPKRPKAPGECRILFLGDSFTYGCGVREADTFVCGLDKRLNLSRPIECYKSYDLYNGGCGGSYTRHWLSLHRQMANRYEPDLVVAVFFLRVGAPPEITTVGMIRQIEEGMNRLKEESALYRHSHIYRLLRDKCELRRLSDKYLDTIHSAYLGNDEQTQEWCCAQDNLLKIKRRSEALGARFALVIFPVLFKLDGDYPLRGVCDCLERFCGENEIPVLSLLPAYTGKSAESLWVSVYNQHPNPEGHRIAADAIYPFIVKQLAMSPPSFD